MLKSEFLKTLFYIRGRKHQDHLKKMKNMKMFLIVALFVLISIPAEAVNWVKVTEGSDGTQWYVETESIRRVGTQVECWLTCNYAKPQIVRDTLFLSSVDFFRYDCYNRTTQMLQCTLYSEADRKGDVLGDYAFGDKEKLSRIIPGTVQETLMKFVCQESGRK